MSILCCYYSHESFLPTYLFIFLTSNILRGIWVLLAPLHSSLQNFHVHFVLPLFSSKFSSHVFIYFSNIKCSKGHLSAPCSASFRSPFCSIKSFFSKDKIFMSILYCHYFHQNFLPTYLFIFLTSNILRGIWVLIPLLHSVLHFAPFDQFSQKAKFSCPTCTAISPTKVFLSLFSHHEPKSSKPKKLEVHRPIP